MMTSKIYCVVDGFEHVELHSFDCRLLCRSCLQDNVSFYTGGSKEIRHQVPVTGFAATDPTSDIVLGFLADTWCILGGRMVRFESVDSTKAMSETDVFFHVPSVTISEMQKSLLSYERESKTAMLRQRLTGELAVLPARPSILDVEPYLSGLNKSNKSVEFDAHVPFEFVTRWPKGNTNGYGQVCYLYGRDIEKAVNWVQGLASEFNHEFIFAELNDVPVS